MNHAKWIALRWSLLVLLVIVGIRVWYGLPDRRSIEISNLDHRITDLSMRLNQTMATIYTQAQEIQKLRDEIEMKENNAKNKALKAE